MSQMIWVFVAVAIIASMLALPPLPRVRLQYRFAARLRHRLFRTSLNGAPQTVFWTMALSLVVAGAGAALSTYVRPAAPAHSMEAAGTSVVESAVVDPLMTYARALGPDHPGSAKDQNLLDVDTMIERLASRLKTTPDDVRGWRMLGWSYFNTGDFEQAALAYERAAALDPKSDEIKQSLVAARERASARSER